ncbi:MULTISPECIES: hypothetical protein [unclassified Mesorhizobium]|uniref:hypothetical protein n=1 Tax=unclassified Mesorhizobium TaxID=325217 RepID=UPI00163D5844|nr:MULTISPECIES: hypothetical protein [unclassified Mesorhizobium]
MTLVGNGMVRMPSFDFGTLNLSRVALSSKLCKFDGYRIRIIKDEGGIRFYTKNGFCGSGQTRCGLSLTTTAWRLTQAALFAI